MPRALTLALALLPLLPLAACGDDGPTEPDTAAAADSAMSVPVELLSPEGDPVGTVTLRLEDGSVGVEVAVTDLPPGVHGFHLHKTGACEPDSPDPTDPSKTGDFLSAGGHVAEEGQTHGDHAGDLPTLLVAADGTATMSFTTDRVTRGDVLDDDGTAVMVHADPDNFANVPERYAPQGPDETTTKTGDAGARIACGALRAAG